MASLSLYLLTFNCARNPIQPETFAASLFNALPTSHASPDILVLSLQEVAPVSYSFLGGSFLMPYFNAFREAVRIADEDSDYVNVIARNTGMIAVMVFVQRHLASCVSSLQTAGVGVGVQEVGNKGAVGVRMRVRVGDEEERQLTFVSAHLAPMEEAWKERNEDWKNIVQGLVFVDDNSNPDAREEQEEDVPLLQGTSAETPSESSMFSNNSYLFFAGDLNYRTSDSRPTLADFKSFPQCTDDTRNPRHFSYFLHRDQLTREKATGNTLHGLTEAPITFPPTYKYAAISPPGRGPVGEWTWARHRWPSWCDRILYLDLPLTHQDNARKIKIHNYVSLPPLSTSDHRPVASFLTIPLVEAASAGYTGGHTLVSSPFPMDPHWKERRDNARRKEIALGLVAYLGWTWEGNGLLLATTIGGVGGWLVIRSLLEA